MVNRIKSYALTILAAFVAATLVYFVYAQVSGSSNGEVRRATANNIDLAIETSPVVVIGKIIDDKGTTRNLRRDSVDPTKEDQNVSVPGTDYAVEVTKVLKGMSHRIAKFMSLFLEETTKENPLPYRLL